MSKLIAAAKNSEFNEECRIYGAKLFLMRLRAVGGGAEYVRRYSRTVIECVRSGAIIHKNVLWMSMFCAKTGCRFPKGCVDFTYHSFWSRPTYYRFRSRVKELHDLWSIHNLKEDKKNGQNT